MTSRMTNNCLYLIIMLKSQPKEEHKPHSQNIQCVQSHVSLRRMWDLWPSSPYSDKASLSKNSSRPYRRGTHPPLLGKSGLWKPFPVISFFAANESFLSAQLTWCRVCNSPRVQLTSHMGWVTASQQENNRRLPRANSDLSQRLCKVESFLELLH